VNVQGAFIEVLTSSNTNSSAIVTSGAGAAGEAANSVLAGGVGMTVVCSQRAFVGVRAHNTSAKVPGTANTARKATYGVAAIALGSAIVDAEGALIVISTTGGTNTSSVETSGTCTACEGAQSVDAIRTIVAVVSGQHAFIFVHAALVETIARVAGRAVAAVVTRNKVGAVGEGMAGVCAKSAFVLIHTTTEVTIT